LKTDISRKPSGENSYLQDTYLESDLISSGQIFKEDATPSTSSKDKMDQVANLVVELKPLFQELSLLTNWSLRKKSALAEARPIAQTLINKEPPRFPSRYSTYSLS
jgi:hypothetical protein